MSFNLLQSVKDLFNNDVITRLSSYVGENEATTQKAVDASLPLLGMGIFNKVKESGGADFLMNLVKGNSGGFLQSLSGMFDDNSSLIGKGEGMLEGLFGNKINNISNAVSQYAGTSGSTATTILSVMAPVIMGVLGRHTDESNLTVGGLSNLLGNQSSTLAGFIPAGLSSYLGNLGLGSFQTAKVHETEIPKTTATTTSNIAAGPEPASANRWLWPLILLLLIGGALWYFLGSKGCNNNTAVNTNDTTASAMADTTTNMAAVSTPKGRVDNTTGDYLYDVGNMVALTLPDNNVINVGENSTEAKLVAFLNNSNAAVDTAKGNWFEFTGVRFKTGSSQLTDSSMQQLKNFAAIAKAYPKAQFKVGGYTDSTGAATANVTLSQKRADAVYAKALSLGASKSSLTEAKGYGPEYPIGDNGTVDGRAMNRRVAINVKAK